MAEEILYEEQVDGNGGGDPKDPLGLRKQLQQKADPLGLRKKVQETIKTPEYKIEISQPTFKPKPVSGARNFTMERTPVKDDLAVVKLGGDAREAGKKLQSELLSNDDIYEKRIRQQRAEAYTPERLKQEYKQKGQLIAVGQEDDLLKLEKQRQYDLPVSKDEIEYLKMGTAFNPNASRSVLAEKAKKDKSVQAALYLHDANESAQQTPDRKDRPSIIKKNVEKVEKGTYVYDPEKGLLFKPESGWNSFFTAWKHKNQLFEDADYLANASIEDKAKEYERRRNSFDPDQAIHVPANKFGEITSMLGGQPVKSMIAMGVVGMIPGAQEVAPFAGAAVGAADFYRMGRAAEFEIAYNEARDKGADPLQAAQIANTQSIKAGAVDATIGGAMPFVAGFGGFKPMPRVPIPLKTAVVNSFKDIGLKGLEGAGIMGGGQIAKNILAKTGGIDREWDDRVLEQAEAGFFFSAAANMVAKGSKFLNKEKRAEIYRGFNRIPKEQTEQVFNDLVKEGQITQAEATKALGEIESYKAFEESMPDNITPEAKVKIADKIKRRNELEAKLERQDKAFHPQIKEQIKAIEGEIDLLAKEKLPKPPKEQADLKTFIDEQIAEGNIQGFTKDVLQSAHPEDLPGYFKDIADQAKDPKSAEQTIATYGDAVVNKALEMYPVEQPKPSSISVIRPEERTQPTEVVTIAPKEQGVPDIPLVMEKGEFKGAFLEGKEKIADGSESTVYRDGDSVVKIGEPYNAPETFNQRVQDAQIINKALGDGSLELIGTYESANGTKNPIFRQKFVEGEKATPEQIDAYMAEKGFEKKGNGYEGTVDGETYRFTDIDGDNAIVDANGKVTVIDAGVKKLKTESSGISSKNKTETNNQQGATSGEAGEPTTQVVSENMEGSYVDAPEMIGISHAETNKIARELGFPEYDKSPESLPLWEKQANERIAKDPNTVMNLINKLRDGYFPDPVDTIIMGKYLASLKSKYDKSPTPELLNQINRTTGVFDIAGRVWGQVGVARQAMRPVEQSLADFHMRDMSAAGVGKLTEKQEAQSTKEYNEFKEAQKNWDAYNAKRIDELATQKAEAKLKELKAQLPKEKKEKKDYATERKQILDDIKKKWKDSSKGDLGASFVPYAKELAAIAPDVAKLVKNLVEQGIDKLPDLIKAVHAELKDVISDIKPEDVRALIAGEYNEKGRTRSQLASKIKDLRDEASLIGRLQELEAGIEPKSERAKVKRNKEIEELKLKLKNHDLTKLAAAKSRMKAEIAKLEKDIADGKYVPEEKTEIKLDKEGQALKDKLIELRRLREIRLAEEEYAQRSTREKIWSYISAPFREVRTLKSSFDLSAPLRQGVVPTAAEIVTNPARAGKRFVNMLRSAKSEKYFNRWLAELKESPQWKIMEQSGLSISEPGNITKKEEVFQSQLAQRIPIIGTHGIKGSERAYSYWLNAQRVDLFKQGAEILQDKGMTFENSKEAYKSWASTVNALTGRGELAGPLKNAAEALSIGFFSPRLIASRLSFFNPMFYKNIPAPLRKMVVGNMLKFVGLGTSILMLSKLAGADVEEDPRSPDFGKIRTGDTRYDIWGGFQQYIRLFSQLATQSKKTSSGKIESLMSDKEGDTKNKSGSVIGTFLRSKAAPLLGSLINVATGEDVVGQPVTLSSEAKRFLLPILWEDVYKAAKEDGLKGALATAIPGMLGVGTQSYPSPAPKKSESSKRKRAPRNKRKNPRTQNN